MSYVLDSRAGAITVTPSALTDLVVRAAERVEGARVRKGRRRLDVELAHGAGHVRLELAAQYGLVLPDLARRVQEQVTEALSRMCAVRVEGVDVSIEEVE
ncbi:MAG TPA: Asp23/Gls24 family envelope stress response protein [Gaiellaceae bacterium]|jgi:uncharacterized alkaline shock family protein YloU|nr:Asp23/Gls24 family envelope stress response protein [Gaiellaceae bacterium]